MLIWKDACTPVFIAVLFTTAKIWKQPKYSSANEWMKKKKICIYRAIMEYYSAIKKNEILPLAAMWMDPGNIVLHKICQTDENKYCMI